MNVLMRQFIPGVIREMLELGPRSNQYFEMHSWAPFLKKKFHSPFPRKWGRFYYRGINWFNFQY